MSYVTKQLCVYEARCGGGSRIDVDGLRRRRDANIQVLSFCIFRYSNRASHAAFNRLHHRTNNALSEKSELNDRTQPSKIYSDVQKVFQKRGIKLN